MTSYSAAALYRVESKLNALQAQVAVMNTAHDDPHYIIGWMEGAIESALIEINVWKETQA